MTQWREVPKALDYRNSPRVSSGSRHLSPRRSHSHHKTFITSSPTNAGLSHHRTANDSFDSLRSRCPKLEKAEPVINANISASHVTYQSQSCHQKEVDIRFEENPRIRGSDPPLLNSEFIPSERRGNIQDRLGSLHEDRISPSASSPTFPKQITFGSSSRRKSR